MNTNAVREYRPATGLVSALTAFFTLYVLATVVALWSGWLEIELLTDVQEGFEITQEEAFSNDARQALVGLSQAGLYLVLVVLFCVWIFRANSNARALGATNMHFTPGWCVGWFFIPIMNLLKPVQAVNEIWHASDPDGRGGVGEPTAGIVAMWWALWIGANILGQAAFRLGMNAETVDGLLGASYTTMVSDALNVLLAIAAISVVRGIHGRQTQRHMATMESPVMMAAA